jgi:hypothetical protein
MTRARSLLCGLMLSAIVCACGSGSRGGRAFEPLPAPTKRYETESARVFVKDERRGVSKDRAFDTPFFSWPGVGETRAVPISSELNSKMAALLQQLVPRVGADRLYFEVYVQRADAGWIAKWFSEEAQATAELQICAMDGTDNTVLVAGTAHSAADANSVDVSDGEPGQLLDAALLNAWERWLKSDSVIASVNRALAEKRRWGRLLSPTSCRP